jgi:glycosyltransferase involved in cell wall biosynthesis
MSSAAPRLSVVVNTYNRAAQVGTAIESVLSQSGVDLELVVVDDGSTDDTQAVLAGMTDARMRCVWQPNRGLSASRNVGAYEARGEWLLFLDDDDRLCGGALEALLTATTDPSCRVVVGGVRFVDSSGQVLKERTAASLGDARAGNFLISRNLYHEAGGYLEGMPCSHQTELFVRVSRVLGEGNDVTQYIAEPVVEIERRPAAGRPEQSPAHTYFGARWLVTRHPDRYGSGRERAVMETLIGLNGMRIGREAEARRRFASAIRHDPLSARRYLRLAGAVVPPIGRRIWLRQWDVAPEAPRLLDRVQRLDDDPDGPMSNLSLERDPSPGPDSLFTPWRYRENPSPSSGDGRSPSWRYGLPEDGLRSQAPFYKLAARLARTKGLAPVVDIGCGPGDSLDDAAAWDQLSRLKPQLVVSSNMVERVLDPRRLLSGIRYAVSDGGMALISTTDRSKRRPETAMGPPSEPCHIREWCAEEFSQLLESCGFEILRIVKQRSSMAFLVETAPAFQAASAAVAGYPEGRIRAPTLRT